MVDTLGVRIVPVTFHEEPEPCIAFLVNGRRLTELVEAAEAERGIGIGSYQWLDLRNVAGMRRELLGQGGRWEGEGIVQLLGCDCGERACWPMLARVTMTPDTVTWSGFEQPHRPEWSYEGLAFTFDRAAYEAAIAGLEG
jgi:hypothetical protein